MMRAFSEYSSRDQMTFKLRIKLFNNVKDSWYSETYKKKKNLNFPNKNNILFKKRYLVD